MPGETSERRRASLAQAGGAAPARTAWVRPLHRRPSTTRAATARRPYPTQGVTPPRAAPDLLGAAATVGDGTLILKADAGGRGMRCAARTAECRHCVLLPPEGGILVRRASATHRPCARADPLGGDRYWTRRPPRWAKPQLASTVDAIRNIANSGTAGAAAGRGQGVPPAGGQRHGPRGEATRRTPASTAWTGPRQNAVWLGESTPRNGIATMPPS